MEITGLNISKTSLAKSGENRSLSITGDTGARFVLIVVNSSGQFYNFVTKVFTDGHVPQNNLKGVISGRKFTTKIQFPSISSNKTYNVIVTADAGTDTTVSKIGGVFNTEISQILDATITYQYITANTDNYATFPSSTAITGSPIKRVSSVFNVNNLVTNASTDAGGFGLRLIRQPVPEDLIYRKTQTVDGAITSGTEVVLDDLTDIAVGMIIVGVSSGSLAANGFVTAIDSKRKAVTLQTAQTFADGITLTFEARGPKVISKSTGIFLKKVSLSAATTKDSKVTKTTRTDTSSSTTINLDGTYGIAGGNLVTYFGNGVDNSASNRVTSVSASSTAGSIVVEASQTIPDGTLLTFKGSNSEIRITTKFIANSFGRPVADRTINLNLDNFITPGAAS